MEEESIMLNRTLLTLIVVFISGLAVQAFAHCDAMEGPVVTEAREALETGEVTPVLKWVAPEDEEAVRQAFDKALLVRKRGPEARELADLYFFQTLVRLHRKSEGEPFTGLKPGDGGAGAAIKAVDASLKNQSSDEVVKLVTTVVEEGVRHRYQKAAEAKAKAGESVEAGREYVHAYVDYIHYAKHLYETASGNSSVHGQSGESHESQMEKLANKDPGTLLEKEHDVTLLVAEEAAKTAAVLRNYGDLNPERINDMLDFFTNFVDRCHHMKEERFYFPALRHENEPGLKSLISELKKDHDAGAVMLSKAQKNLEQARDGSEEAKMLLAENLSDYASLIRAHIIKENTLLMEAARRLLSDGKQQEITNEFLHYEHEVLGKGFHQKYHDLAMSLTEKASLSEGVP